MDAHPITRAHVTRPLHLLDPHALSEAQFGAPRERAIATPSSAPRLVATQPGPMPQPPVPQPPVPHPGPGPEQPMPQPPGPPEPVPNLPSYEDEPPVKPIGKR